MMWRRQLALGALLVLLVCSTFCNASSERLTSWSHYLGPDGSVSFYYPEGWIVEEDESGFMIYDEESFEQLWLVILPYERIWTAQEHAEFFLALIQEDYPDMDGSNWEPDESGNVVVFDLQYGTGQESAHGYGLMIKDTAYEQALWFHYLAPQYMFSEDRGLSILEGFVNSLASGAESAPPAGSESARMERINRNADGFLFILEFALGSPLSLAEETLIATELKEVLMEYSEEELAGFDEYPLFVQFIMSLQDQEELAEVKLSLEESVWGWVEESDPDDPIVSLIREAMLQADRIIVPGRTPLTEVAAMAYAEFVAFAEHLWNGGIADPGAISDGEVQEIKEQLVEAWGEFSQEEKEQVLQLPAVWTTLRRTLYHGDEAAREHALLLISNAVPQGTEATSDGETYNPNKWLNHQATLAIQQQTFNHYMWSVGYHSTIWGF